MPEGPSIVIAKEEMSAFAGKVVTAVAGNTKTDKERLLHKKVLAVKSWGKHLLICFSGFTVKIHFMLFGSYRINEEKDATPRLSLHFKKGCINFYTCSVQFIEGDLDDVYDWTGDIMADSWDAAGAKKKLKKHPGMLVCDALLNQDIFAGSGNIIKNEVMFRIKVHPLSRVGALPARQLKALIDETRNYAFDFLEWKKKYELKKHWLAYNKKTCPRNNIPFHKEYIGAGHRKTFFCNKCQVLYE